MLVRKCLGFIKIQGNTPARGDAMWVRMKLHGSVRSNQTAARVPSGV